MEELGTKAALAESFRRLAAGKDVNKITVAEIASGAGRSHATFYRHFQDKHDLAAWDYARSVGRIMARLGQEDACTWREILDESARFFQEERAYIANLLEHTSGFDSFSRYMTEESVRLLANRALQTTGAALDRRLQLCIRAYAHGVVQLICEWIEGTVECTPGELAEAMDASMPEPLIDVLRGSSPI